MTLVKIYRILCDAPHCTASDVVEKATDVPHGWSRLDSRDYQKGKPLPEIGRGRHRRTLSSWDAMAGGFAIALCPDHPTAFGVHYPQTLGNEAPKRASELQYVRVGCACAWGGNTVRSLHVVGRKPASTVEYAWFAHLPEELRWYATREAVPA